jgi:ectoine hydroxylase
MWTDTQLQTYREQGFLFQPGLLSPQQIDELRASTADLVNEKNNPEEVHIVREKSGPVRTVFCMHRRVEPWRSICRSEAIGGPVKQILGDDAYIFHSKLNLKESFEGTVWLWHQDYGYWQYDGVDDRLVSVLIMFGPNTIHNGCVLLVAGSHKWGVLDHYDDDVTTSYKQWCIQPEALRKHITDEGMIYPVVGQAGDVCFFDCNIVHGSNHNFSPAPRQTVIFAYSAIDNIPKSVQNPRPDWVVSRDYEPVTADLPARAAARTQAGLQG